MMSPRLKEDHDENEAQYLFIVLVASSYLRLFATEISEVLLYK